MEDAGEKSIVPIEMLNIKIESRFKSNPKYLINRAKDADRVYVNILLFLLCCENLEEIDVAYLAECVFDGYDNDSYTGKANKITEALNFWKAAGVLEFSIRRDNGRLSNAGNVSNTLGGKIDTNMNMPELRLDIDKSIDRLSETLETQEDFRRLTHETQMKFRRILNPQELGVIYNLYNITKIDVDLLSKLAEVCAAENKNTVYYLEKIALGLSSNGIFTVEDYERTYREASKVKEYEEKILVLFKMEGKKYTSKQKYYIKRWAIEFDFSDNILSEGYNICMDRLGSLSFGYINGIFSNWHAKGFATLEEIRTEFNKTSTPRFAEDHSSSFNIEQFFEKAVQRAMRY